MIERVLAIDGWEKKGNAVKKISTGLEISWEHSRHAGPSDTTFYYGYINIKYPKNDDRKDCSVTLITSSDVKLAKLVEEKVNAIMKSESRNYNLRLKTYERKEKLNSLHREYVN